MSRRVGRAACLLTFAFVMTAGGFPPVVSQAGEYTSIDVDSWDYDRTEALENQISVQGDVEYEPPADLDTSGTVNLDVDYSNQMVDETKEPEEKVTQSAVTVENTESEPEQVEGKSFGWWKLLVGAAVGGVAILIYRYKGRTKS